MFILKILLGILLIGLWISLGWFTFFLECVYFSKFYSDDDLAKNLFNIYTLIGPVGLIFKIIQIILFIKLSKVSNKIRWYIIDKTSK